MDENVINFQGSVKIPNEIRDVKNTILFGLTGRQLGMSAISITIVGIIAAVLSGCLHIDTTVSIIIGVISATPSFAFGFIRPGGMPLEDWLLVQYSNYKMSSPVRKLYSENAYETALRLSDEPDEKDKKKSKEKKKKGKPKKRKKVKTSYKFRK